LVTGVVELTQREVALLVGLGKVVFPNPILDLGKAVVLG
jgi:hypothetical protein